MYRSAKKETLTPNIVLMEFEAPRIDSSTHACQFVIIRTNEAGGRIPLMIREEKKNNEGKMDAAFFVSGSSTSRPGSLWEGESVINTASPLGKPAAAERFGTFIRACGCFGSASVYRSSNLHKYKGNSAITVIPLPQRMQQRGKG